MKFYKVKQFFFVSIKLLFAKNTNINTMRENNNNSNSNSNNKEKRWVFVA